MTKGERAEHEHKQGDREERFQAFLRQRLEHAVDRLGPAELPLPPTMAELLRTLMGHLTIGGPCAEFPFVQAEFGDTLEEAQARYKTHIATLTTTSYRIANADKRKHGTHYALLWRIWQEPLGPDYAHLVPRALDGATWGWRLWKVPKKGINPTKQAPLTTVGLTEQQMTLAHIEREKQWTRDQRAKQTREDVG